MSMQDRLRQKQIHFFFFRFLAVWLWCGDGVEGKSEVVGEANTTIRQSKEEVHRNRYEKATRASEDIVRIISNE